MRKRVWETEQACKEKHVWLQGGKVTRERCKVAKTARQQEHHRKETLESFYFSAAHQYLLLKRI